MVWFDAIIVRLALKSRESRFLNPYAKIITKMREEIEKQTPYYKCTTFQQGILEDINKLKNAENKIAVDNILQRNENEFINFTSSIKKNALQNKLSIFIGIFSIAVSIWIAMIK